MKNLGIAGVPNFMENSCFSFDYNNLESFKIVTTISFCYYGSF